MRRLLSVVLLACASCAVPADPGDAPPTVLVDTGGKADAPELRVRAADMTLWVDAAVRIGPRDGEVVVELLGRTSRNLTGAFAWVPDDRFGEAALIGPRSFAVRLRAGHELDSILSGLPLFVGLDVAGGAHPRYD